MITVHHLENSRSQRVLWLLEELGEPYAVKRYERDPETMLAPPALRAIHPLGKSPVVEVDGKVLIESGAIVDYLVTAKGEGALLPGEGEDDRIAHLTFMHYAEGSLQPLLLLALVFRRLPERAPALLRPLVKGVSGSAMKAFVMPRLAEQLAFVDEVLSEREWFGGTKMTGADIMMSFPLEAAASRMADFSRYPHAKEWVERVHGREAYQRALDKGGPYDFA